MTTEQALHPNPPYSSLQGHDGERRKSEEMQALLPVLLECERSGRSLGVSGDGPARSLRQVAYSRPRTLASVAIFIVLACASIWLTLLVGHLVHSLVPWDMLAAPDTTNA